MLNNTQRRGFAIPVAILVILVLTIMVAGGFSLVSAERRSVADQKSQISAFRIAEQGLEIFLVRRDSLMKDKPGYTKVPGAADSIRISMTGGYADVTLTRLRAPRGNQAGLYVVRSKGVETAGAYAERLKACGLLRNTPCGNRLQCRFWRDGQLCPGSSKMVARERWVESTCVVRTLR